MCKLNDEQLRLARELHDNGETYHDVSLYLRDNYGIDISSESLRYYVTRKDKPRMTKVEKLESEGVEKVLLFGDCHIPYHIDGLLDIVRQHKNEISTLIIGGDLLDNEEISVFPSLGKGELVDEMAETHKFLKELQDLFPDVKKILIKGNHCARFDKYLAETGTALNPLHSPNILREIVDGFKKVDHKHGTTTYYEKLDYTVVDTWWYQYNDMIVCHPMKYSKIQGRVTNEAIDYFVRSGLDFSACMVFHTHKVSMIQNFDKWGFEVGCTCQPMPYASSGKLSLTNQANGYHIAVFKDGKYDINDSKQYII